MSFSKRAEAAACLTNTSDECQGKSVEVDLSEAFDIAQRVLDAVETSNTNLLQKKLTIESTLSGSSEDAVSGSSEDLKSTPYVPGSPGAAWSQDEVLVVKAKLWHIMSLTKMQTGDLYKSLHERGFDAGPLKYRREQINRMAAQWLRLGFHGCFPDAAGGGGCDGCLMWDDLGRLYMDYFYQEKIPFKGTDKVNFNNGLTAAVELLEAVYKNASFPPKTPTLSKSLFETGKSRADLWAFAAMSAVEFGVYLNNMVCEYPDFEYPLSESLYPDSLESNSFFGRHCTHSKGTAQCNVQLGRGFIFKTGRKDCVPLPLYHQVNELSCPIDLEITSEAECKAAGASLNLDASKVSFFSSGQEVVCKFEDIGGCQSICYRSQNDIYNGGKSTYYVDPPILGDSRTCRGDLIILTENECKEAAADLFLPFDDSRLASKGCFMVEHKFPEHLEFRVHFGEGSLPPADSDLKYLMPGRRVRAVCRMVNEKAATYMSSTWGAGPDSQMDGDATLAFFKDKFQFTPRETAAIMGAHTMGRFHGTDQIFRYIWIRNGGMLFNNAYYRNMVLKPDYRFVDPSCGLLGDAYGQPPPARWTVSRRGEKTNKGPINWVLERYVCAYDCQNDANFDNDCCTGIPKGGHCSPDNNRPNGSDPLKADNDVFNGCEKFNTEPGNHESAIPAEMGLYYKFTADENGQPSGCPGFDDLDTQTGHGLPKLAVNCPKNDKSLGEGNNMKLFELIERYADDNNLWITDFIAAFQKMLATGYKSSDLVDGPAHHENIVCPNQGPVISPDLKFLTCFRIESLANCPHPSHDLSAPFLLMSYLDDHILQMDPVSGTLEAVAQQDTISINQKWYWATTKHGKTLVNGINHWGAGNWQYDATTHYLRGAGGILMRKPKAGESNKIIFEKNVDVSWLVAGWAQVGLQDPALTTNNRLPSCLALKTAHGNFVNVGPDGRLTAKSGEVTDSSKFNVHMKSAHELVLECKSGGLVTVDSAGNLGCTASSVSSATVFKRSNNLDGSFTLQAPSGSYVAADLHGDLTAKRNFERFKKIQHNDGSGTISFQGAWDKYMVGEWWGGVKADRTWLGAWERFHPIHNSDGTLSAKTVWGKYWKEQKSGLIDAYGAELEPECKFTEVANTDDGTFSYRTKSGKLVVATGDGFVYAGSASATAWEHFIPVACNAKQ